MKKLGLVLGSLVMLGAATAAYSFPGNFSCNYASKVQKVKSEPLFGQYLISQLFSFIRICNYDD